MTDSKDTNLTKLAEVVAKRNEAEKARELESARKFAARVMGKLDKGEFELIPPGEWGDIKVKLFTGLKPVPDSAVEKVLREEYGFYNADVREDKEMFFRVIVRLVLPPGSKPQNTRGW